MRLSRESRYAVLALMAMAIHPPEAVLDSRVIAAESGLPAAYLAKILRQLAAGGVLRSQRGRGFALAEPPSAITLGAILDAVEGPGALDDRCIFWRETCSDGEPCPLHFRWQELRPAIESALARVTLAEIIERGGVPLMATLGVAEP